MRKGTGLKKSDALNLLFYIYVPPGTGLTNTRQSTWMNPIIDGVEAKKLIGRLTRVPQNLPNLHRTIWLKYFRKT